MNISAYNQALNQAMPWTAHLYDLGEDLPSDGEPETNEDKLQRTVDTETEFGEVVISDKKGSTIL